MDTNFQFFITDRGLVPVLVSAAAVVGSHLETRDTLEVHHLQHLLGLSINLDDVLFQGRHIWDDVVPSLLLLKLDGDASHGGALKPLHKMSDEPGNLVAQRRRGREGTTSSQMCLPWNRTSSRLMLRPR